MIRRIGMSVAFATALLTAAASAQEPTVLPRIGALIPAVPSLEETLRQSLRDLGYVEGKTILIDWRRSEGTEVEFQPIVADLIRAKVDLIVAWGTPAARAAVSTTRTIPIVFCVADPLGAGLVPSLSSPGRNATGVGLLTAELTAKRLEILRQIVPRGRRFGYLRNPSNQIAPRLFAESQQVARTLGLELVPVDARTAAEVEAAFRSLPGRKLDALIVSGDLLFLKERARIAKAVRSQKLPTAFPGREELQHGAVMSYGWNMRDVMHSAAGYVDKIRRGAKPADLPVEQISKYELVINLPIAREMGLAVPQDLLLRADEVIR
jgi:putative ABC transport system substrate-binding protein